jgi:tetratricopeptide (TPR) repeat protein
VKGQRVRGPGLRGPRPKGLRGLRATALALAAASALASAALSGCSALSGYAAIAGANRLHGRGDYQGAAAAYLAADARSYPATLAYDLANVYARLGEHGAAAGLYAEARRSDAPDAAAALAAAASVNEGLSLYERGRFEEAWLAFRDALSRSSGDGELERDARLDLELAWRAWKQRTRSPEPSASPTSVSGRSEADEAELRLLERLETGAWRPGAARPDSGGADY